MTDWKSLNLLRDFLTATASNVSPETFCIKCKGFFRFFFSGHSFFVTTPHYFDLSSYDYSRDFPDSSRDFPDSSRDFPDSSRDFSDFSRKILSDPRARVV